MAALRLLSLDLRSPLVYTGLENPPLSGAPFSGTTLLTTGAGVLGEVGVGENMAEGEEELFLFDEVELVGFDPDDGPTIRRPIPRPRFYGRRAVSPESLPAGGPAPAPNATLAAGGYAFLQWRPGDEDELLEGLEWFAKEVWWEKAAARGPYILRRIKEDGRLATQALRKLDG